MSAHKDPWFWCCSLGKKAQRHKHKKERQQVRSDLRRGKEPRLPAKSV